MISAGEIAELWSRLGTEMDDGESLANALVRAGRRTYPLPGVGDNHGPNNPLLSEHPGGCQATLLDGSVPFLTNDTDLLVLKALAIRDDGLPLPKL